MKEKRNIPVEKNGVYTVEITGISSEGNGIAQIDGYVVFVPQTVEGDLADILIVKAKSAYGFGKLLELKRPSPKRCKPACAAFSRCGGCQLMHIAYKEQLKLKERTVRDALERIGGYRDFQMEPIIGMEEPWGYRNKTVFPIGQNREGKPVCGFYAQRSHTIIPVDVCPIGPEINRDIISTVLEHMNRYGISCYNEISHRGLVRRLFTRFGRSTGEIMVILSVNGKYIPQEAELVKALLAVSDRIVSVILNIHTKQTNLVLGEKNRVLYGRGEIRDMLLGNEFEISPYSFYQVNPQQTERLYQKAIEYAGIGKQDHVMDLYCGIGTISLSCARYAGTVTGVEIVPEAVEDAKANARRNRLENVKFYCSDAAQLVPKLIEQGERPDVVILDPPRKGSDPATLKAICEAKPRRIVYISCNPATLARDVAALKEWGYGIEQVCPVDMFPMTMHVETVVMLRKSN